MTHQPTEDILLTVGAAQKQKNNYNNKAVKSFWRFYQINCNLINFLFVSNLESSDPYKRIFSRFSCVILLVSLESNYKYLKELWYWQHKRQCSVDSILEPQEYIGFTVPLKSHKHLCLFRWLNPNLSWVSNFRQTIMHQKKHFSLS